MRTTKQNKLTSKLQCTWTDLNTHGDDGGNVMMGLFYYDETDSVDSFDVVWFSVHLISDNQKISDLKFDPCVKKAVNWEAL